MDIQKLRRWTSGSDIWLPKTATDDTKNNKTEDSWQEICLQILWNLFFIYLSSGAK